MSTMSTPDALVALRLTYEEIEAAWDEAEAKGMSDEDYSSAVSDAAIMKVLMAVEPMLREAVSFHNDMFMYGFLVSPEPWAESARILLAVLETQKKDFLNARKVQADK